MVETRFINSPPGTTSVPIHVELSVKHPEIILITHKFWVNKVHSRTYFSLKNVKHHFSSLNCESARPNDFCSREESQKSLFLSEMRAIRYYSIHEYFRSRPFSDQSNSLLENTTRIGCKDIIDMRSHVAH